MCKIATTSNFLLDFLKVIKPTHISPTQICAHTNFMVRAQKKVLTDFQVPLLQPVPWVYLKPPMPMDTNLHVCGREVNSVTMPRLKQRLPSDVLRPKKGLRSHLSASNFQKNFPAKS